LVGFKESVLVQIGDVVVTNKKVDTEIQEKAPEPHCNDGQSEAFIIYLAFASIPLMKIEFCVSPSALVARGDFNIIIGLAFHCLGCFLVSQSVDLLCQAKLSAGPI
jgi:hypothetical protein